MFSKYDFEDEKQKAAKRLKTCSFNYLEHKLKQEYAGGLVMRVDDDGDDVSASIITSNRQPNSLCDGSSKYDDCSKSLDDPAAKTDTCKENKTTLDPNYSPTFSNEDNTESEVDENFDYNSSMSNEDRVSNISLSDLEGLLDKDLPEKYKCVTNKENKDCKGKKLNYEEDFIELEKILLDELGNDHFDLLPEGWIKAFHEIGIPVYLDRHTRNIALSRPYFLGSADLIEHNLPLSSIPCLRYRKRLEKYTFEQNECVRYIGKLAVPIAKLESVEENQKSQALSYEEVRQYCDGIIPLKIPTERDSDEAVYLDKYVRPSLPPGTKLISFPVLDRDGKGNIIRRKDWVLNPRGKGYVALLHEFSQQAVKAQPLYRFRELKKEKDHQSHKQEAVVILNDEILGTGYGNSKKEAKLTAAKTTLEILIPELEGKLDEICVTEKSAPPYHSRFIKPNKTIFDDMKITDPRVVQLSARTIEPPPYSMLLNCLRRNYGACQIMFKYDISARHNALNKYTMLFGKHKVTVNCKNKQDGKQKSAQTMLQVLHPYLNNWGALIELYGAGSLRITKDKKQAEKEITSLQFTSKVNQPNFAVLNKLIVELKKKSIEMENKQPIPPIKEEDIPTFDD